MRCHLVACGYGEPNTVSNAVNYARFCSGSKLYYLGGRVGPGCGVTRGPGAPVAPTGACQAFGSAMLIAPATRSSCLVTAMPLSSATIAATSTTAKIIPNQQVLSNDRFVSRPRFKSLPRQNHAVIRVYDDAGNGDRNARARRRVQRTATRETKKPPRAET